MRIYNTMNRKKEEFIPIEEGKAGIYSCGPTVYNYFHIGNARPFIIFDTLRRYLEYRGYEVTFVQNFTDIDDKMITRSNEEGVTVAELAERFIAEYYKDADALGIQRPTYAPHATEHIPEIITTVEKLIENGKAYEVGGDVYYSARSFTGYGKLSGQNMDDLESGARVAVEEIKRDPMDFALWKAQKPAEPAWESPWGMGRPGWHIECSAMSMKYLGESFDIHCGGQDLIFPHHENEIAQSEGATGKPFARYWMHNGYINIDNRKMSKSLGNFFTVREIAQEYDLMAVRLFMLNAHYRNPVNFSRKLIEQADSALGRIRNCHDALARAATGKDEQTPEEQKLLAGLDGYRQRFIDAMDDDLNTADALGSIFDLIRDANTVYCQQGGSAVGAAKTLALLDELLGVLGLDASSQDDALAEDIQRMADARAQARKDKNWAESDRLRDELKELGYIVEDTKDGQVVKKGCIAFT